MSIVAEANVVVLIVAALIGVAVGWWFFRRARTAEAISHTALPAARDGGEGNAITDQAAAAAGDVAGPLIGAPVHAELPGAGGPPDVLTTMKGVGPKFAALLNEHGVTRFDQLAALDAAQADALDARMGAFKGRLGRDRVAEQAAYLARGDRDGFEAQFGKLGG